MLFDIPNELIPYVRISKKSGLVCSEDMPESLIPLYQQAKKEYEAREHERLDDLKKLLVDGNTKQE